VAVDAAAIEAVNRAATLSGSILDERPGGPSRDHFRRIHPNTDWSSQLDHAVEIGLGRRKHRVVEVD
jgi:uncharacterized Fe-S center protein